MQKTSGSDAKESRINVRISQAQKALISRAAQIRQTTLTEFVVENVLRVASQLVAEEKQIVMTPEQFKRFCRALDAPPPRNLKAMKRLLSERSILDE